MSEPRELVFLRSGDLEELLPVSCTVMVSCYESPEIRDLIAITLQSTLQSLAGSGMDLRALDGVTLTENCAAASLLLQAVPGGHTPLQLGEQPDTLEMARTVPVWRAEELRFHIVLRAGLGLGLLSTDLTFQALAYACIAHEAAHVEHEGHLYRTLPEIYGKSIPCGDRCRKTFLKAMDVWSEYAACRSSAMFRPEAVEEFERIFIRSLEDSLSLCRNQSAAKNEASHTPSDFERVFGDVFLCAGYFLGHVDGLGLNLQQHAPAASTLLALHPEIGALVHRLQQRLNDVWVHEHDWSSIEVFSPLYAILCAMMTLQGFTLTADAEWKMVT